MAKCGYKWKNRDPETKEEHPVHTCRTSWHKDGNHICECDAERPKQ